MAVKKKPTSIKMYVVPVTQVINTETGLIVHVINEKHETSNTIHYIDRSELKDSDTKAIFKFIQGTHRLYLKLRIVNQKEVFFGFSPDEKNAIEIFAPKKLQDVVPVQLKYLPLRFGLTKFFVQQDGFHVIVAPTGSGKTYNTINNLPILCKNFELVIYLHLELSESDIYNRFTASHKFIPDNLILGQTTNLEDIKAYVQNKKACIIVDNIDNLIGAGEKPFDVQLEFVLEFDRWAKQTGNMGIFLTQFVKEGREKVIVKDKISDDITINQLSGVKQISNMSRSVIMTYYDGLNNYVKVLKKGSGKYEREITGVDKLTYSE